MGNVSVCKLGTTAKFQSKYELVESILQILFLWVVYQIIIITMNNVYKCIAMGNVCVWKVDNGDTSCKVPSRVWFGLLALDAPDPPTMTYARLVYTRICEHSLMLLQIQITPQDSGDKYWLYCTSIIVGGFPLKPKASSSFTAVNRSCESQTFARHLLQARLMGSHPLLLIMFQVRN